MSCAGPGASDFLLSFGFRFLKRPDWVRCSLETFRHLPDGFWVDCTLCWPWKRLERDDDGADLQSLEDQFWVSQSEISVQSPSRQPCASAGHTLWVPSTCYERPRGPCGLELLSELRDPVHFRFQLLPSLQHCQDFSLSWKSIAESHRISFIFFSYLFLSSYEWGVTRGLLIIIFQERVPYSFIYFLLIVKKNL